MKEKNFFLKLLRLSKVGCSDSAQLSDTLAPNGLRVGDVALCCPEAAGRQGNIAYTLLWDG
jgi:hypothetical protein